MQALQLESCLGHTLCDGVRGVSERRCEGRPGPSVAQDADAAVVPEGGHKLADHEQHIEAHEVATTDTRQREETPRDLRGGQAKQPR